MEPEETTPQAEQAKTKLVFCANCQEETEHVASVNDRTGDELLLECETCGRVLKFPLSVTQEELVALLSDHQEANAGQVTKESQDKKIAELLG